MKKKETTRTMEQARLDVHSSQISKLFAKVDEISDRLSTISTTVFADDNLAPYLYIKDAQVYDDRPEQNYRWVKVSFSNDTVVKWRLPRSQANALATALKIGMVPSK